MPRLVALTLLSVLVIPAGALVYTVVVVVGFELLDRRHHDEKFMLANALTFGLVVVWWLMLWGRAARWRESWGRMAAATAGCVLSGLTAGIVADRARLGVGGGFGPFVGGATTIIAWLVAACLIWRDPRSLGGGRAFTTPEAEAAGAVLCLKCGYALTGLREARCPECGEAYTLDALFAGQPARPRPDLDGGAA